MDCFEHEETWIKVNKLGAIFLDDKLNKLPMFFPVYKISSRIDMNDSGSGRIRWIRTKFDHKKIVHV